MTTTIDDKTIQSRVGSVLDLGQVPFVSLTSRIQEISKSRVTWQISDLPPGKIALCQSVLEQVRHESQEKFYVLPHHVIQVDKQHCSKPSGRFAVAHEIGHILLHFPLLMNGMIHRDISKYDFVHYLERDEQDANVFAAALCFLRSNQHIRINEVDSAVIDVILDDSHQFDQTTKEKVKQRFLDLLPLLSSERTKTDRTKKQRVLAALRDLFPNLASTGRAMVNDDGEDSEHFVLSRKALLEILRTYGKAVAEQLKVPDQRRRLALDKGRRRAMKLLAEDPKRPK